MSHRKFPEETAATACRRAGLALRDTTYADAACEFFALAIELVGGVEGESRDAIVDAWEEDLRRLQKLRREGLWRAFRLDERSRQSKPGSNAWRAA